MNKKLNELYKSHWNDLSKELNNIILNNQVSIKPSNPLLLSLSNETAYIDSDIKIMIVGQETNNWENDFYDNIDKIESVYKDFLPIGCKFKHKGFFKKLKNLLFILLN